MKTIKLFASVALFYAMLDMGGFAMWILSNQTPVDGFYIGTLTAHALALFI